MTNLKLRLKPALALHPTPGVGRRIACRRRHCCQASQRLRPLLIDNYDSYTYNLYQIVAEVYGVAPLVLHNDAVDIGQVQQLLEHDEVHHIILSPGPGSPERPADVGVCMDILRTCLDTPLLGVCLGHQALAAAAGGAVIRAPEPVHGRLSPIRHTGHELFAGCPSGAGFDVVRYHSLIVDSSSLPSELEAIAWSTGQHHPVVPQHGEQQQQQQQQHCLTASTAAVRQQHPDECQPQLCVQEELIMAVRHRQRPHYGVQFHPESIATCYGIQLLLNFRDIACKHSGREIQQQLASNMLLQMAGPPGRAWPPRPWPAQQQHMQTQCSGAGQACANSAQQSGASRQKMLQAPTVHCCSTSAGSSSDSASCGVRPLWVKLSGVLSSAGGSVRLFEQLVGPGPDTFWLDSASAPERSRFSYLGGGYASGPMACRVTYNLPRPHVEAARKTAAGPAAAHQQHTAGVLTISSTARYATHPRQIPAPHDHNQQPVYGTAGNQQQLRVSIWDYLQEQLQHLQLLPESDAAAAQELPFNFWGGFVGYFGYEMKAETGGSNAHAAAGPDAAWLFADRVIVCDHDTDDVYLLALHAAPAVQAAAAAAAAAEAVEAAALANQWLARTAAEVEQLVSSLQLRQYAHGSSSRMAVVAAAAVHDAVINRQQQPECPQQQQHQQSWLQHFGATQQIRTRPQQQPQQQQQRHGTLRHDQSTYVDNVNACQAALMAGDSYELCLTTAYEWQPAPDPWQYYQALRRTSPAPHAAWLNIGGATSGGSSVVHHSDTIGTSSIAEGSSSSNGVSSVIVCCSSPERFLQGGRGGVLEAKPIKGTAARHCEDPAADVAAAAALISSEKERAENLMIVDLIRNDLGKVCEPGSVHVPGLIQLESYAAVHQLVSTVRGLRRPDATCIDAIRAAFPGGSMTGAPKIRSMDILDGLEGAARGVYSGALGYLSVNDTFDLNIVIRTAVFYPLSANGTSVEEPADAVINGNNGGSGSSCGSNKAGSNYLASIGAGGAVVVQSDSDAEFAEMQLKARKLLETATLVHET